MAGGNHLLLDVFRLRIREHQRIVGDGIQFDVEHALGLLDRIAHRAMHLRDAAQRIAVLRLVLLAAAERAEALVELLATVALVQRHPVPADVETQLLQFAATSQLDGSHCRNFGTRWYGMSARVEPASRRAQVGGDLHLSRMRTQRMHFRRERTHAAGEGIDRHRRGEVGGVQQFIELVQRQHAGRQHLRGAVVEREAFLVASAIPACRPARRSASPPGMRWPSKNASPPPSSTIARCDSGARSPEAPTEPSCGTTGTTPALSIAASDCSVSHADAGVSAQQRIDADAQHRAHHVGGERLADADRMRHDQVVLQFDVQRTPRRCAPGSPSRNGCAPSSLSALLPKPVDTP